MLASRLEIDKKCFLFGAPLVALTFFFCCKITFLETEFNGTTEKG